MVYQMDLCPKNDIKHWNSLLEVCIEYDKEGGLTLRDLKEIAENTCYCSYCDRWVEKKDYDSDVNSCRGEECLEAAAQDVADEEDHVRSEISSYHRTN